MNKITIKSGFLVADSVSILFNVKKITLRETTKFKSKPPVSYSIPKTYMCMLGVFF